MAAHDARPCCAVKSKYAIHYAHYFLADPAVAGHLEVQDRGDGGGHRCAVGAGGRAHGAGHHADRHRATAAAGRRRRARAHSRLARGQDRCAACGPARDGPPGRRSAVERPQRDGPLPDRQSGHRIAVRLTLRGQPGRQGAGPARPWLADRIAAGRRRPRLHDGSHHGQGPGAVGRPPRPAHRRPDRRAGDARQGQRRQPPGHRRRGCLAQ